MTPQEFKAWFDGFTEALEGPPNEYQWSRIKARAKEIDGKEISRAGYGGQYVGPGWRDGAISWWGGPFAGAQQSNGTCSAGPVEVQGNAVSGAE